MDIEDLKLQINNLVDQWAVQQPESNETIAAEEVKPERADGKRVVRTKSTGDRVYMVDDKEKTKAWVTSPEILTKLGFTMEDVQDIEDSELLGYQMAPSIYRIDE